MGGMAQIRLVISEIPQLSEEGMHSWLRTDLRSNFGSRREIVLGSHLKYYTSTLNI